MHHKPHQRLPMPWELRDGTQGTQGQTERSSVPGSHLPEGDDGRRLKVRDESQVTAITILHHELPRVPWHVAESHVRGSLQAALALLMTSHSMSAISAEDAGAGKEEERFLSARADAFA